MLPQTTPDYDPYQTLKSDGTVDISTPSQTTEDTVPIASEVTPISPELAAQKATIAKMGLGVLGKSYEEIYSEILAGREEALRDSAATRLSALRSTAASKFITELARERNRPMSEAEAVALRNIYIEATKAADPKSVFEELYADLYTRELDKLREGDEGSFLNDVVKEQPHVVDHFKNIGKDLIAKRQYALKNEQEAAEAVKNQTWIGWGIDMAKNMIPFYSDFKLRGNVEEVSKFYGLLGDNLEAQAIELLKLPFEEYKIKFDQIMERLKRDNPSAAVTFANAVKGMSSSDVALENFFNLVDLATILPTGKLSKSIFKDTDNALKDLVKSTNAAEEAADASAIAAAGVGNVADYAEKTVTNRLIKNFRGLGNPTKDALESLPSIFNTKIEQLKQNPGRFGNALVNQLEELYSNLQKRTINTLTNVYRVERLPELIRSPEDIRNLREAVKEYYPGINNYILDITAPYKEPISNTYFIDIAIGKPGTELFSNRSTAETFMKVHGLDKLGGVVDNRGSGAGFYIRLTKPLDETMNVIRDAFLSDPKSKSPNSLTNAFLGRLRNPDEVLSLDQRTNRKVATYATSELLKLAQDVARDISKIGGLNYLRNKERWKNLERTLEAAKELYDKQGRKGYFFETVGELEEFWLKNFNTLPDQKAIKAYFAYVALHDLDYVLRNVSLYRNKTRLGVEKHRFYTAGPKGKKITSDFVEGVLMKEFPRGDGTILVVGDTRNKELLFRGNEYDPKKMLQLSERVRRGELKVIRIYDPDAKPLSNFSLKAANADARVEYVVTPNLESKPLDWIQIPYRAGGHFEYDYPYYIKQARVHVERIKDNVKHWYTGDTTVMPISVKPLGESIAKHLDQVRVLLKANKKNEARQYAVANLPIEWKELSSWFKPKQLDDGTVVPPRLNLNEPIRVVGKDQQIVDIDKTLESRYADSLNPNKTTFRDGTKQGSLAKQNEVAFTGERDADKMFTIEDVGTKNNPIYKVVPVRYIDPIPTINRAISKISNSIFMDDYKIYSVEHWVREAAPYLQPTESELRSAPYYHFYHPDWKADAPRDIREQLEIRQHQIRQLLGTPSSTDVLLQSAVQKLADSIYSKLGSGKVSNTLALAPSYLLPVLKDPFAFIRSITFHAKLGLFNIPQILVQAQTYTTILGIAGPSRAIPGSLGVLLHMWANVNKNPVILETLDKYASRMGWRPGEWKEAYLEMSKSGFDNVAGEVALLDNQMSAKTIQSGTKRFLDAGAVFFREGERAVRRGAWYTAFKEFRSKNPGRRLTDEDRRDILERADTLNVNMSRASNTFIHQGLLSLPTQFFTYQIRAFELFTGKRLTNKERARLLGTYALFYGFPASTAVSGFPFSDYIRASSLDRGYVPGENLATSAIMEGVPALLTALVTGNWYNINERYGIQGFELIREALRGDQTFWQILGGAAGSTIGNTVSNLDGFTRAMSSIISGDGQAYPLKVEDFVDVFKEVSSVNNTWRLFVALNTHKWISKKEIPLSDVSSSNAIFMYLTGLQPTEISDLNLLAWNKKSRMEFNKHVEEQFIKNFQRALRAYEERDPKTGDQFMTRAYAWLESGDFPIEERPRVVSKAIQGMENLIDRIDDNYWLKNVPDKLKEQFMDIYVRRQKLKE